MTTWKEGGGLFDPLFRRVPPCRRSPHPGRGCSSKSLCGCCHKKSQKHDINLHSSKIQICVGENRWNTFSGRSSFFQGVFKFEEHVLCPFCAGLTMFTSGRMPSDYTSLAAKMLFGGALALSATEGKHLYKYIHVGCHDERFRSAASQSPSGCQSASVSHGGGFQRVRKQNWL